MRDIRVTVDGTLIELWHRQPDASGNNDTHCHIGYLQFEEASELCKLLPPALKKVAENRKTKLAERNSKLIAERAELRRQMDAIDRLLND